MAAVVSQPAAAPPAFYEEDMTPDAEPVVDAGVPDAEPEKVAKRRPKRRPSKGVKSAAADSGNAGPRRETRGHAYSCTPTSAREDT